MRPRRSLLLLLVLAALATSATASAQLPDLPVSPEAASNGETAALPADLRGDGLHAGAAAVDATWHVGASQGQYAGPAPGTYDTEAGTVDPHAQSAKSAPTHGVESRDTVRALVLDDGQRRWAMRSCGM
jgi:hypothetical protein